MKFIKGTNWLTTESGEQVCIGQRFDKIFKGEGIFGGKICYSAIDNKVGNFGLFENSYLNECFEILFTIHPYKLEGVPVVKLPQVKNAKQLAEKQYKEQLESDYTNIDKCITGEGIRGFVLGFNTAQQLGCFTEEQVKLAIKRSFHYGEILHDTDGDSIDAKSAEKYILRDLRTPTEITGFEIEMETKRICNACGDSSESKSASTCGSRLNACHGKFIISPKLDYTSDPDGEAIVIKTW